MKQASSRKNLNFVGCFSGGILWAIDIDNVSEIILPVSVSPLPHASPNVLGTIHHRQSVVPIVSLQKWLALGHSPSETMPQSNEFEGRKKWILVRQDGDMVGLEVDEVSEVFATPAEKLRPAPERFNQDDSSSPSDKERQKAARGAEWIVNLGTEIAYVLNLDYFFGNIDAEKLLQP